MRRYYSSLAAVRDPALAQKIAQIALSEEIAPQAESLRLQLIVRLAGEHPQLAWDVFRENSERLLKPQAANAPLTVADYLPEWFWRGVPIAEIETWVRAHVPSEMEPFVARGMDSAKFRVAEKQMLVSATADYLRQETQHAGL